MGDEPPEVGKKANGDEEDRDKERSEGEDVGTHLIGELGFGEEHAGEEGAESGGDFEFVGGEGRTDAGEDGEDDGEFSVSGDDAFVEEPGDDLGREDDESDDKETGVDGGDAEFSGDIAGVDGDEFDEEDEGDDGDILEEEDAEG